MSVLMLKTMIDQVAEGIIGQMTSGKGACFDLFINPLDNYRSLTGYPPDAFTHRGIYGIRLSKDGQSAIAYIGKTENDNRLRHHILGENKNGTESLNPGSNKHEEIRRAISHDFSIQLCLYKDPDLNKPTLSCLEIACILRARSQFNNIFPAYKHWNKRVG